MQVTEIDEIPDQFREPGQHFISAFRVAKILHAAVFIAFICSRVANGSPNHPQDLKWI